MSTSNLSSVCQIAGGYLCLRGAIGMIGSYYPEQTVSKQREMFDLGVKRIALGIAFFVFSKSHPKIEQIPSLLLREFRTLMSAAGIGLTIGGLKSLHMGFQNADEQRRKSFLMIGLASSALGITALTTRAVIYIYENRI